MVSARSLLESATRTWVMRRDMGAEFGRAPVYVSPGAGLRFLFKPPRNADPELLALAADFVKPGNVVWDIGANVGLFSTASAHLAGPGGRVIAMEPDPFLIQLLRRTSRSQAESSAPITVVPVAVAEEVATRDFVLAKRSNASNHLDGYGASETGGALQKVTVLTVTGDWLLGQQPAPNVVKIDVEGAEVEVLKGSSRVLKQARPVVIVEVQRDTASAATEILREYGYKLYNGQTREQIDQADWSTVAIPS